MHLPVHMIGDIFVVIIRFIDPGEERKTLIMEIDLF
jgi:hypothetical protein